MMEIQSIVTGEVQRVSFRAYVQDSATDLGLTGFVFNKEDGSVEVLAQGMTDVLKDFVEYLNEGSLKARVESVSVDWRTPGVVYDDFSIRH